MLEQAYSNMLKTILPTNNREYGPVWEYEEPRLDECSICGITRQPGQPWELEVRNSGPRGRSQEWGYCPSCASLYRKDMK